MKRAIRLKRLDHRSPVEALTKASSVAVGLQGSAWAHWARQVLVQQAPKPELQAFQELAGLLREP
jgi:hypothetical protein